MEETKHFGYKCKQCGIITPAGSKICSRKRCGANLTIYGELGELDDFGNWMPLDHTPSGPARPIEIRMVEPTPPPPPPTQSAMAYNIVKPVANTPAPKPTPPVAPTPAPMAYQPVPPVANTPAPTVQDAAKPQKVKKTKGENKSGSKKWLAILLALLLITGIVALVWCLSDDSGKSSKKDKSDRNDTSATAPSNSDGTTNPTNGSDDSTPDVPANGITAPDFGIFANLPDSKRDADSNYFRCRYEVPFSIYEQMVDEYVDCLEDNYPFKQTSSTAVYDDTFIINYTYTGPADIKIVGIDDGIEHHFQIFIKEYPDDDKAAVTIYWSKDITLVDPGVYFDYSN